MDVRRSLLRSFLLLLSFTFSFVISASALGTANVRCEMVLEISVSGFCHVVVVLFVGVFTRTWLLYII